MSFGSLFQGSPPAAITSSTVTQQGLPAWYQEITRGIAAKGANEADWYVNQLRNNPYDQERIANFNPDQINGFDAVRANQAQWQPGFDNANAAAGNIAGAAAPWLAQGQQSIGALQQAGTQAWPQNYSAYMNPYQSQVVDEIARLGNQNFAENLLPQVDSTFVGAGQYGSSRNAEILGRAMRDTQQNITGQQSQALQQGWNTSANIFNQDQQRGIQANQSALQGANTLGTLASGAQDAQAQRLGALSQQGQGQYARDASQLGAIGDQQQAMNQRYLDQSYNDYTQQRDAGMNALAWSNGLTRGMQLPTSAEQVHSGPGSYYSPSPLASIAAAGATYMGSTANKS